MRIYPLRKGRIETTKAYRGRNKMRGSRWDVPEAVGLRLVGVSNALAEVVLAVKM